MPAYECEEHGTQIAARFCEHAATAVASRQPMEVYLQRDQWGWYTLCPECVGLPKDQHEANSLVCERCAKEWVDETGSDYLDRCKSPVEELPGATGRGVDR
ncbi:MAG: hypothetical protein KC619_07205 [Myxococcales bacterium]|nr:hypothetical protein [Myxococcales bacterium]